jgi:hypothetical protein
MFEFFEEMLLSTDYQGRELLKQRRQIQALRKAAVSRNPFDTAAEDLAKLQVENIELRLYIGLLFRVLVEKGLTTPEDLKRRLAELDASDGDADGKHAGSVLP